MVRGWGGKEAWGTCRSGLAFAWLLALGVHAWAGFPRSVSGSTRTKRIEEWRERVEDWHHRRAGGRLLLGPSIASGLALCCREESKHQISYLAMCSPVSWYNIPGQSRVSQRGPSRNDALAWASSKEGRTTDRIAGRGDDAQVPVILFSMYMNCPFLTRGSAVRSAAFSFSEGYIMEVILIIGLQVASQPSPQNQKNLALQMQSSISLSHLKGRTQIMITCKKTIIHPFSPPPPFTIQAVVSTTLAPPPAMPSIWPTTTGVPPSLALALALALPARFTTSPYSLSISLNFLPCSSSSSSTASPPSSPPFNKLRILPTPCLDPVLPAAEGRGGACCCWC